jgi:tRNA(Ile2)-agmatinylcytidine synthase
VQTEFHIGIDDTDSRLGGCTTHLASSLFQELESRGFEPIDYPWLVRLNPNVPFKTRGNGALSLHLVIDHNRLQEAKEIALATVEGAVDLTESRTDPAVVFLSDAIPDALKEFSERALHDMIPISQARQVADDAGVEMHLLKGSRGLVGALASIGANLDHDHTFELIAYRKRENIGTPRRVDHSSIREMSERFRGSTFNNVDPETGRVLVCPHGPDPVLLGIRGEDPEVLMQAFREIRVDEEIESTMIFKTNQGTDAHLRIHRTIAAIRPYQSTVIDCRVGGKQSVIRGGHVIFRVADETGSIDCAAYRATGSMRDAILQLVPGDSISVSGGIRPFRGKLTLNVEKLEVTELVALAQFENPHCTFCGARCESMGMNQGFRCRKCKARFPKTSEVKKLVPRKIGLGITLPPPRAHRHLTKPISRHGIQRSNALKIVSRNIDMAMESRVSISTAS